MIACKDSGDVYSQGIPCCLWCQGLWEQLSEMEQTQLSGIKASILILLLLLLLLFIGFSPWINATDKKLWPYILNIAALITLLQFNTTLSPLWTLGKSKVESWSWWSHPATGFPLWPRGSVSPLCTSVSLKNTMLSYLKEVSWEQIPGTWGPLVVTLITDTGKTVWVIGHIPFLWHLNPKEHLNQNITG